MNSWIQTFTGKKFYPLNPNQDDICIKDIAHALSMICRFNGHSVGFYSVAEHSILVSKMCNDNYKLRGLLHDASEAYISDVGKPIKPELTGYREIEKILQLSIYSKFNVCQDPTGIVKEIDRRILVDEQEQVMCKSIHEWSQTNGVEKLGIKISFLDPINAEIEFLKMFYKLTDNQLTTDGYELP